MRRDFREPQHALTDSITSALHNAARHGQLDTAEKYKHIYTQEMPHSLDRGEETYSSKQALSIRRDYREPQHALAVYQSIK